MHKLLILNGPNLNLLGQRESAVYGKESLADIEQRLTELARLANVGIAFFQSNSESALIDAIQQAFRDKVDFILFNPAAFTHTSIALRDAILAVQIPMIEIHLSNIHKRETYRQVSYFSDVAIGTITGFGAAGYEAAFQLALNALKSPIPS